MLQPHVRRVLSGLAPAAFPLTLLAFNAWLAHRLFVLEYGVYMSSIECSFIAIARFLLEQWPDIAWMPYWYGGIPIENAYSPLMQVMVALWAGMCRLTPALAYHQVLGAIYCLAPVTLYLLTVRLGASRPKALLAAALYSVLSPSAILIEEVRLDIGGRWYPRRMQNLLPYGEGPHQLALVLLPLALIALDRALERRSPSRIVVAAIAMAAVAAINWIGALALALGVGCLWFARGVSVKSVLLTAGAALIAYLMICGLLPPRTIHAIQANARHLSGDYSLLRVFVPAAACGALLLAGLRRLLVRLRAGAALQFYIYSSALYVPIVLGMFWYGKLLLPQATRYQVEMDIALIFAAVLGVGSLISRLPRWVRVACLLVFGLFWLQLAQFTRLWDRAVAVPIDITQTIEYQIAQWCKANVREGRVYLGGSTGFWLNVWANVPQIEGGFNNGIPNWTVTFVEDAVRSSSPEVALLWLEAYGVRWVNMAGGKSRSIYHYMQHPAMFAGMLEEVRKETEDVIYHIARTKPGFAHRVREGDLVRRVPRDFQDAAELRRYVAALEAESGPSLSLRRTSNHSFEVRGDWRPDDILSVQESWYPGWQAHVNGKPVKLWVDGLGLMAAAPRCAGPCVVQFEFKPAWWPFAVMAVAWFGSLIWIVAAWQRRWWIV